jgi:hypothetical protein
VHEASLRVTDRGEALPDAASYGLALLGIRAQAQSVAGHDEAGPNTLQAGRHARCKCREIHSLRQSLLVLSAAVHGLLRRYSPACSLRRRNSS